MTQASNTEMYCCDKCGKHIRRRHDLDRHMQLHAKNKEDLKHSCPYTGCSYKALQLSNLQTHLNTHTGERPHKCPQEGCDFSTGDRSSLTRHRQRKHGYDSKANSGKKSATKARRTTQQSRFTPYSTSSRPSRISTASAVSQELSPSSSGPQLPPPQLPQPIDGYLPSSVLVASERVQELKNGTAAFETELALKFAQAKGSQPETETCLDLPSSSLLYTVPFTEPGVPTDLAQLMSLLEQQNSLQSFDQPDVPVSQPTPQSDVDAEFDRFLARYDDYLARALSTHDNTFQSTGLADNSHIATASTSNTIDDGLVSGMLFLPPSDAQHKQYQHEGVNSPYQSHDIYGYFTRPMSFNAVYAQPDSFAQAAPPYMSIYPQTVASEIFNPTYPYTTPATSSAFPAMQHLYAF